jgi:hypothetical protein
LSHRKTLRFLSIEMNPFHESFDGTDVTLSQIPVVTAMESSMTFCTPSVEQQNRKREEELMHQFSGKKAKKPVKKSQTAEELEKSRTEDFVIQNTYLKSSLGPLFLSSAKHVSFRGCDLDDDDVEDIAELLAENNEIISLNLWGNSITDRGGIAIAKALRGNRVLRSISLAMNKITDKTVNEICKSLWNMSLYTEEELIQLREKVFKSTFGSINIPRDASINYALQLPAMPMHLRPLAERKKAEKAKKPPPNKNPISTIFGDAPIVWEEQVQRHDIEEPSAPKSSRGTRGTSASSARKSKQQVEENNTSNTSERKPLFTVPGNVVIRSINLSANVNITDEGAGMFLNLPYIYLDRLNLSYCNVSNEMFDSVSHKMNESPPEEQ